MYVLGDEVDEKRQEQLEADVERGALDADATYLAHDEKRDVADEKPEPDAPEEVDEEGLAGVCETEGARHRRGDGELERHDARRVVEERLAGKQGLLARVELDILAQRGHCNRVGRAERGPEREGGGERDGGHEQVQREADAQDEHDHQPDSKAQDGVAVRPQQLVVGAFRLVEQERCDEQDQEQPRVDGKRMRQVHEEVDDNAQKHLDERQRDSRQERLENCGNEYCSQEEYREFE